MSKAFTKGDEGVPEIPVRPLVKLNPGEVRYITPEGQRALLDELQRLETEERKAAAKASHVERASRLADVDSRIASLKAVLSSVTVAPAPSQNDRVAFGSAVTIEDEDGEVQRFRIVGPDEADAKKGLISVYSPIARALLGREVGESVTVQRPQGLAEFTVVAVEA